MADPVNARSFADLPLRPELLEALSGLGYEEPTPIQREAIPPLLAGPRPARPGGDRHRQDRRVRAADPAAARRRAPARARRRRARARARRASSPCRSPRRSTATAASSASRVLPIYGGQPIGRQLAGAGARRRRRRRHARAARSTTSAAARCGLGELQTVVLDEADEMLDMGFAEDIEAILDADARRRARPCCSRATMPPRIDAHRPRAHLRDPVRIEIGREPAGRARRRWSARPPTSCRAPHKPAALGRVLDVEAPTAAHRLLPHPRRGRPAHRDAERPRLPRRGAARRHEPGAARPGDGPAARAARPTCSSPPTSPPAASTSTSSPTSSTTTCPSAPEAYVHRIGRVGRAGREGVAITLAEPREHRHAQDDRARHASSGSRSRRCPTVADLRARRLELTRAALRETLLERRPRPLPRRRRDARRRVRRGGDRAGRGQAGPRGDRRRAPTTRRRSPRSTPRPRPPRAARQDRGGEGPGAAASPRARRRACSSAPAAAPASARRTSSARSPASPA